MNCTARDGTIREKSMSEQIEEIKYLTIEEVARILHMTPRAIQTKVKSKELPAYKPAKRLLFKREDVEKWLKKHPAA